MDVAFFHLRMALDSCGAGDSTRRKMDLSAVAEVTMEVVPLEMYDSARAKIDANLRWLFAKAYGIGKLFNSNPILYTCIHTRRFRHNVDTL